MTTCGLGECELWAPQIEPQQPSGRGRPPAEVAEVARRSARVAAGDAARSLHGDQEEVRRGRHLDLRLQLQPERQLHRRGDRPRLRDGEGARRRDHHRARRRIEVAKRIAPFAEKHKMIVAMHGHSNTSTPGEFASPESFAAAMKHVEVLQGQPRHRPLHRRQLRRGAVPPRAPRRRSRTCTSRTASTTRATTCRGARATRRFARCCSC